MRSSRHHGFVTTVLAVLLGLSVVVHGGEASAMLGKMFLSGLSGSGEFCEACGDSGMPPSDKMNAAVCFAACLSVGQHPVAAAWVQFDVRSAVMSSEADPPIEWRGILDPSPPRT